MDFAARKAARPVSPLLRRDFGGSGSSSISRRVAAFTAAFHNPDGLSPVRPRCVSLAARPVAKVLPFSFAFASLVAVVLALNRIG